MTKTTTVGMLMLGTALISVSQVKHPSVDVWGQALATIGGALLAFANTHGLWAEKKQP